MKTKRLFYVVAVFFTVLLTQSCLNSHKDDIDSTVIPNALVTVKTNTDNVLYLQLDDKTTLLPTNITKHPFDGKQVRAILNYREVQEKHEGFDKAVYVNWIDSILTKPAVQYVKEDEKEYGNDFIDIFLGVAEDDYLTLGVRTLFSRIGMKHKVTLLYGKNPDDPYEVELRHNAFGDSFGNPVDAYVAFDLRALPDTHGEEVNLKLVWKSYMGGTRSETIKYKPKERK